MEWDLGPAGLLLLLAMSAGFALAAQVIMWKVTHRMWLIEGVTFFFVGLFTSEVWFGWATEEDLQPNIDGLSFDEVLLIGFGATAIVMLLTWLVVRHSRTTHVAA